MFVILLLLHCLHLQGILSPSSAKRLKPVNSCSCTSIDNLVSHIMCKSVKVFYTRVNKTVKYIHCYELISLNSQMLTFVISRH